MYEWSSRWNRKRSSYLTQLFNQIDEDGKGYISVNDLKELAEELKEDINES